jgi:hypothetical protein
MPRPATIVRSVTLLVLAAHLLLALTKELSRSLLWVRQGLSTMSWDLASARRAALGDAWVDAIGALRQAIPRDGEYFLVNADSRRADAPLWVRFELAPRRARFLGSLAEVAADEDREARLVGPGRWVVVALPEPQAPRLLTREQFLHDMELRHASP